MNITKLTTTTAAVATLLLLNVPSINAQDATPAAAPSAAPSASAAPSTTPAADAGRQDFRARIDERIKTALKASDDEWAVIQPLLDKVETLQRDALMGRFSMMGGGFNRRGGDQASASPGASPAANRDRGDRGGRPDRTPSPETAALQSALESDGTSTDDIKAKLQALRDSRKKTTADLEQAREDLEKVLTLRQEATLVMMGILE